ncbi:unnamed protein product, partial [Urochloa humidicola]
PLATQTGGGDGGGQAKATPAVRWQLPCRHQPRHPHPQRPPARGRATLRRRRPPPSEMRAVGAGSGAGVPPAHLVPARSRPPLPLPPASSPAPSFSRRACLFALAVGLKSGLRLLAHVALPSAPSYAARDGSDHGESRMAGEARRRGGEQPAACRHHSAAREEDPSGVSTDQPRAGSPHAPVACRQR